MTKQTVLYILMTLFVFLFILITIFLVLANLKTGMEEYYYKTCLDLNNATTHPKLITYSGCNCLPPLIECNCEYEAGVYCELQNGSLKDITIRESIV